VFAQQFAEFRDAALFVLGQVIVNVPAKIIPAKILVIFLAGSIR
jgi:hypothetical protein